MISIICYIMLDYMTSVWTWPGRWTGHGLDTYWDVWRGHVGAILWLWWSCGPGGRCSAGAAAEAGGGKREKGAGGRAPWLSWLSTWL